MPNKKPVRATAVLFFGLFRKKPSFNAIDGNHTSIVEDSDEEATLVDDLTKSVLRIYSSDNELERDLGDKYREVGGHPERFLLDNGFVPISDSRYVLYGE